MARDLLIGIDAGTSMIKAVAFDLKGEQVGIAARPNAYDDAGDGRVEQDMDATWRTTAGVLRDLAEAVPDLPERAAALAVTGQGDGTWLVGEAGEAVAPAWLWLDSRAAAIVAELRKSGAGADFYKLTGSGLNACMQGAQLAWLRRHAPDVLARAAIAMHCKDWLYLNLTGVRATDPSEGVFSFGDFRTGTYAPEILDHLGLGAQAHLLPPIIDGTTTHHGLTPDAAGATGLPQGLPVVLGYVDVVCTALGGGIYHPDRAVGCTVVGTTGMHMRLSHGIDEVALNEACTGYTMRFPAPGAYAQMQSNMAATLNIDWLARTAGGVLGAFGHATEKADVLARLDAGAAGALAGRLLYHPYIHAAGERGPFIDPNARAGFVGLSMDCGIFDLTRAVYEGLGYAAADCYAAMGGPPDEVRLAGGAARSRTLRQVLAACLDRPVRAGHRAEAGAAGAAMIASVALKHYPSMAACCADWVEPTLDEPEAPDEELARRYAALFPVYREARERLGDVWRDLRRGQG